MSRLIYKFLAGVRSHSLLNVRLLVAAIALLVMGVRYQDDVCTDDGGTRIPLAKVSTGAQPLPVAGNVSVESYIVCLG